MNRTIYILGGGAIGKSLAVFLKLAGKSVVLVRTNTDSTGGIQRVNVHTESHVFSADIDEIPLAQLVKLEGIVIVTSKSFANKKIAEKIAPIVKNAPVIVMQNGLDVELPFIDAGIVNVFRCVLFATSQSLSQDTVRFKPVAPSPIGNVQSTEVDLGVVITQLSNPQFLFRSEPAIELVVWRKTIANCVFNSVCPLLDVDNGIFHRHAEAFNIAKKIVAECISVAGEIGITLTNEEVLETILMISKSSDGQLISTLQDIREGRNTEIMSLNFAVANIAAKVGKPEIASLTRLLGEMVLLKSQVSF